MSALLARLARHFTVGLIGLAAAAAAPAQDATASYAVLSLIGDELTVVTYQPAVGRNVDPNMRQVVPLRDETFDRHAVTVAEQAIQRSVPGARTTTFVSGDRALYAGQDELVASDARASAYVTPIVEKVKGDSRYLLLVTKHRGDARLRFARSTGGSGKLAGLGFYVDRIQQTTRTDTGQSGSGFIAPYAYLAVTLVDTATGTVVRTMSATESQGISSARAEASTDPWAALTAEEKVRSLEQLIGRALDRLVPLVIGPR